MKVFDVTLKHHAWETGDKIAVFAECASGAVGVAVDEVNRRLSKQSGFQGYLARHVSDVVQIRDMVAS